MNKRQKKKLYKQEIGKNPPKKMKYSGKSYHRAINKPWGDSRAYRIKDTKIVMVKEKKTNGNDNSK